MARPARSAPKKTSAPRRKADTAVGVAKASTVTAKASATAADDTAASAAATAPALKRYRAMRNFGITAEPSGEPAAEPKVRAKRAPHNKAKAAAATPALPSFVIQKHWA